MLGVYAEPPEWALAAGLPAPEEGELFVAYCSRLGLDTEYLTEGLTEQTAELANLRLRHLLSLEMAEAWEKYKRSRIDPWVSEKRKRELLELWE